MKNWFDQLAIRYKLYVIVLLACFVALLLTTSISLFSQRYLIREQLSGELQTLSTVIAENCRAGIAFKDKKALDTILHSLAGKPAIITGRVIDTSGELYAEYNNASLAEGLSGATSANVFNGRQIMFHSNYIDVVEPVILDGETIGHLQMLVSLNDLQHNQMIIAALLFVSLLFGLLIAMSLSSRLLQMVVEPVLSLLATMQEISRDKQYDVRTPVTGGDELGQLAIGFNDMLTTIQLRDEHLEEQVEERTNAYLKSSATLVPQLQKALAAADITMVQNAAHSLKSSSANIGALRLSQISKELEMCCKNNTLDNVMKLVTAIETEFIGVKIALTREISA